MKAHTFKDLVQMTMTGDEVFYLAEDVGSLIIRKNLLLNEKDARIAELEKALHGILGYFRSGNSIPVERATIKADAPEIIFAKSVL